jgi:alpha-tubulin suppressor-like RCC1 family protein
MGTHECAAVKTDGTLWTWGLNGSGSLGQNNTTRRSSPTQVGALTNWSSASMGDSCCIAIKTDGTLWSWGNAYTGRLGQNDIVSKSSPVQVGALTTWASASAGKKNGTHVTAIKTDGTLWSWGNNNNGQLGQNDLVNRSSPVQVGGLTTWAQSSAGLYFSAVTVANPINPA